MELAQDRVQCSASVLAVLKPRLCSLYGADFHSFSMNGAEPLSMMLAN
jgi:hypothetical protein